MPTCRPERSEGPHRRLPRHEILRCAQDDSGVWPKVLSMKQYIVRRVGYSLLSLFLLSVTIFLFVRVTGDP